MSVRTARVMYWVARAMNIILGVIAWNMWGIVPALFVFAAYAFGMIWSTSQDILEEANASEQGSSHTEFRS